MTDLERENLAAQVKAYTVEERRTVIENLPIDEMLEIIRIRYIDQNTRYEKLVDILKS